MGIVVPFHPVQPPLCPVTLAARPGAELDRARADIAWVLGWRPVVDLDGWVHDGVFDSDAAKNARLMELLARADAVAAAMHFLFEKRSRRTLNRRKTGIEWAVEAERWHATTRGQPVHIPLGCLAVALMSVGNYRAEPIGRGPDVVTNISDRVR